MLTPVSVITPVHDPAAPHLRKAYDTLLAQNDVAWEWLVQFDGQRWRPPGWLGEERRARVEVNGSRCGVAETRNRALVRSRTEMVFALDSDDMLCAGALGTLAAALRCAPALAYAVGNVWHLVEGDLCDEDDHGREPLPDRLGYGQIPPGALADYWEEHDRRMPFAVNATMWRRDALFAAGGWAALEVGEDTCLMLAVSHRHPGVYLDRRVIVYRQHAGSTMHQPGYWEIARPRDSLFVAERVNAMRRMRPAA